MAKDDSILTKMRSICLSLPDTQETITWGQPHFRVFDKIFSGCGEEKGKQVIGFKLEMEHADFMMDDPRCWRAPYVGHKGWVSMDASQVRDWEEVRLLVEESYRLIAPKKSLLKWEAKKGGTTLPRRGVKELSPATKAKPRPSKRAKRKASPRLSTRASTALSPKTNPRTASKSRAAAVPAKSPASTKSRAAAVPAKSPASTKSRAVAKTAKSRKRAK